MVVNGDDELRGVWIHFTLNLNCEGTLLLLCGESFPKKALQLLPIMLKRNVLPRAVNYSTLISAIAKQSNPKKAVTKLGITFNVKTYTILIDLCTHNCGTLRSYYLFEEMQERGVYPDQIAYTILITAFCNTG
ncbi:hypothetical protein P8452_42052 [Trifolium repens]|nr:hypothetical protein P8452_42052 [Trifolium repens]